MKKLRVALIMLLAMLLSVALFACGGKKKKTEEPVEEKIIRSVGVAKGNQEISTLNFTDAAGETQWQAELATLTVTVVYRTGGNAKLTANDCTVTGSVAWGTVGNYTVTITPKENNTNNLSATLSVIIDHDFHLKEGSEDTEICSVDKATRIAKNLDVELKWKGFHVAGNYEFTKEDATESVRPFGTIQTATGEQEVRTTTVGRLEKGMTITLYGTAQNANNLDYAYYFPILGFADTAYNGPFSAYSGATGIFVRNEGWVLRNGVGTPRLLAGLVGGPSETDNYGSHPSDEGGHPDGYDTDSNGYGPSNYEDWRPWHVYSHGTQSRSEDYVDTKNVKFSWSYYDIDQEGYGLITLTFYMLNKDGGITSSLVCTCKVPDSDNGYYDSILHGEFVNMTFSRIETVQTRTLTSITYNGLKAGAKTHYLENELLDFSTLNVTAEYEQNPGVQETDTQFDVQTKITVGDKVQWVSLRYRPLTLGMTEFRIVRTVGGDTKTTSEQPLTAAQLGIKIHKNAVDVVYGYQFEGYKTNGTIGEIPVVAETSQDATYVSLTLPSSVAASSYGTDKKFVSLRLYARDGATQFYTSSDTKTLTVKAGETALTANDDYIVTFADGSYVDLIIFVNGNTNAKEILSKGVTISGLVNEGVDVKVNLSAINGTESISEIVTAETETVYLEKGGKVTIKYHIAPAYWLADKFYAASIDVNGNNDFLGGDFLTKGFSKTLGGVAVSATANDAEHTITVVYNIPKVSVTKVLSYKLQLNMLNEKYEAVTQAIDTVYYDLKAHSDNTIGIYDESIGAYLEANGTKLYLVQVFENTKLSEGLIRSDSLNLSINTGTKESVNYLDLGYTYENGAFVFANSTVSSITTGTLTAFGTIGNDYDYDYGAVAVLEVDLSKLPSLGLDPENAYYFEINGAEDPDYIYKVETVGEGNAAYTKLSKVASPALIALPESIAAGSCLTTGYDGKAYKADGETVVFYAGVKPVRGYHSIRDGICEHCGATVTERPAPTAWFGGQYTISGMIAEDSFVEFVGTYSEDETECGGTSKDTMNGFSIVIKQTNTAHFVLNADGYFERRDWKGGDVDGWGTATVPHADVEDYLAENEGKTNDYMTNSLITDEHPYNTINGLKDAYGNEINAEIFNAAKIGATYRYTLTRAKGSNVLSVRMRLFKQGVDIVTGTPYIDFTYTIELASYDELAFQGYPGFTYANSTLAVVSGSLDNLIHDHAFGEQGTEAYYHCSVCGALNPAHTHTFDSETDKCECGVFNPNHEHDKFVVNGVCSADGALWRTTTVSGKTYGGYATPVSDLVNNDKSGTWWDGNTSASLIPAGDFVYVLTWNQTNAWLYNAIVELVCNGKYFDAQFFHNLDLLTTQTKGQDPWGDLYKKPDASSFTKNGEDIKVQPAASVAVGDYTVTITRVGNTLSIEYKLVHDEDVYVMTETFNSFAAEALTVALVGNPYFCLNIKGYVGTLSEIQGNTEGGQGENVQTPAE